MDEGQMFIFCFVLVRTYFNTNELCCINITNICSTNYDDEALACDKDQSQQGGGICPY